MPSTPPDQTTVSDDGSSPEQLLIRPSRLSDIADFHALASLAGAGFTSLPASESLLADRLLMSERAFAGEIGTLTLALEDRMTKRVVGCAAVKPCGMDRPGFLNFAIDDDEHVLIPTARYSDLTEVGSLLLHPDYRKNGIGPWLARSRFLFIAANLDRFGAYVFSELRGLVDENDQSPFYNAVCLPHFSCSFAEADDLCAHGRQAELNALLPERPFSLHDLPVDALKAIGRPHFAGRRALDYLRSDGFRFEGIIDLLDGGPAVTISTQSIGTIKESFAAPIRKGNIDDKPTTNAYVAVGQGPHFRCCHAPISFEETSVICSKDVIVSLEARQGAIARIKLIEGNSASRLPRPSLVVSASNCLADCESGAD